MRFFVGPYNWKQFLIRTALIFGAACIVLALLYSYIFGPTERYATPQQFIVNPGETVQFVSERLKSDGIVRSSTAFRIAFFEKSGNSLMRPGGYNISKDMDTLSIAKILASPPPLAFVTFPPSIRKEQIGEILSETFFWDETKKLQWYDATTNVDPDFVEGVYYGDIYLIPSDQPPAQIAARMRGRFTDVFSPFAKDALQQGLDWRKVLTLASIVDREAAKNDKALVAGILWNRLHVGMRLQADATLQYAKGKEGSWWSIPRSEDKYIDSPFNTYKYAGLPPHPIDNPSLDSIAAVLHPEETKCLYYLHDENHVIHCSVTYAGQKANVKKHLQ